MIFIKKQIHVSSAFSHPVQSGNNSITYTINHNFGKWPTQCELFHVDSSGVHRQIADYNYYIEGAGNSSYWDILIAGTTINTLKLRVYRIAGTTEDVYLRLGAE